MNNILTVCIGNICRSPVAEAMLKAALPGKNVWSAGLAALEGHGADKTALEIAREHGLDLSAHRAQQLSSYMCTQADLILVMETAHKQELEQKYPFTRGKVHCLGHTGPTQKTEIADPYRKNHNAFVASHLAIEQGVAHWASLIKKLG
ncbi:MAG: low molecular weight protein-tyrosine-phosphatase [Advenella sp.]